MDQVLRGCYNNGTCVAPDTCECAEVTETALENCSPVLAAANGVRERDWVLALMVTIAHDDRN